MIRKNVEVLLYLKMIVEFHDNVDAKRSITQIYYLNHSQYK